MTDFVSGCFDKLFPLKCGFSSKNVKTFYNFIVNNFVNIQKPLSFEAPNVLYLRKNNTYIHT